MTTKPEAFSCATSLSATTLDMVSADCVRASALPLVKASASAVSTSRGSAGREFVIHGIGGYKSGRTFQERNGLCRDRPIPNVAQLADRFFDDPA